LQYGLERSQIALAAADLRVQLGGGGGVLPDFRRGRPLLQFLQLDLAASEVKDDPSIPTPD
jgi:hypothetical protein